jgi:hypothetical protein
MHSYGGEGGGGDKVQPREVLFGQASRSRYVVKALLRGHASRLPLLLAYVCLLPLLAYAYLLPFSPT